MFCFHFLFLREFRVHSDIAVSDFFSIFDPRWLASRHSRCMFRPADQNCLRRIAERPGGANLLGPVHGCIAPAHPTCTLHRWRRIPVSLFPAFLFEKSVLIPDSRPTSLSALAPHPRYYSSSDFLSNLLVLLLRILNAGIPDSGLIAHLSEATAGSLNGVGHAAYEEFATYSYVFSHSHSNTRP